LFATLFPITIYLVFFRFKESLFASNHFLRLSSSMYHSLQTYYSAISQPQQHPA